MSGPDKDLFLKKGQEGVYNHTKGFEFWIKHWDSQSEPIQIVETANQNKLCGTWISDPEDVALIGCFRNVKQYFTEDGRLIYHVLNQDQKIFLLTYRIENNVLITDQPSFLREKKTHFRITREDKLELEDSEGVVSRYIRIRFPEHLLLYR